MYHVGLLVTGFLFLTFSAFAQTSKPVQEGGETTLSLEGSATFEGLGDLEGGVFRSHALGVSADGSVVVGYSESDTGIEAFRWIDGVMEGLGMLAAGDSRALAASADGSVIVGWSNEEAFRWENGEMVGLGNLPGGDHSLAQDVSADGSVVVGYGNSDNGENEAFRWESGVMIGLGDFPEGPFGSWANGVSADGSVIVGQGTKATMFGDYTEAARWEEGEMTGLGFIPGGDLFSNALAISANSPIIVGVADSGFGIEAFRWEDDEMVGLGELGNNLNSFAYAATADGSVVVGSSVSPTEAFRWTETEGMQGLKDILENDYGLDLTGWTLRRATGISDDGTVVVGEGTNPEGNNEAWRAVLPSPAASVAGWQLLSVPGSGLTVDSLAGLNLVQGVGGSYPGAAPNLLVGYEGPTNDDYTPPTSVEDPLEPGRGFFWYLFEADAFPGTPPSEWVEPSAFELPAPFGILVEEDVDVSFDAIPESEIGDLPPFMIGNPFQVAFDVGGVSVDGGTLQTNVFTWDPQEESYVTLTAGDSAGVWEGFWAEVDGATAPLTFTLDFESTLPLPVPPPPPPPPFEGDVVSFVLPLQLRGTLDSGERMADLANTLRFEEDGMLGWDRHDGSKLMPPPITSSYALLSPGGTRNGQSYRQSVRSLPGSLNEAVTVPVAFLATEPGAFELSVTSESLPEGWGVTLRDLITGSQTNLLEESYAFDGVGGEAWQDRFEITVTPAGVVSAEDVPVAFRLSNPAPNPATESTALVLQVPEAQNVTARVYDALGRQVATIHDGTLAAGAEVRLEIDTASLAAGTYVVRVEGEAFAETRQFAVVR